MAEILGLAGLLVAQFSLLWYKLGKVEQKITDHCAREMSERRPNG